MKNRYTGVYIYDTYSHKYIPISNIPEILSDDVKVSIWYEACITAQAKRIRELEQEIRNLKYDK